MEELGEIKKIKQIVKKTVYFFIKMCYNIIGYNGGHIIC